MAERLRERRSTAPEPFLKVSLFDQITSSLQTVLLFLFGLVAVLYAIWLFNKPPTVEALVPIEFVELAGGDLSGSVDDNLDVQSSEDIVPDPSMVEQQMDDVQVEEMLDQVVQMADQAAEMADRQFQDDPVNNGPTGRVEGNGKRAGGSGDGERGIPRENRWIVRWGENATPEAYAAQLDFFGIELGALTPDGKLIYLSKLSSPNPVARTVTSGADEKRLYMTWQAGDRQQADLALFEKAGVKLNKATLFHFYPPQTEAQLASLEVNYANKPPQNIRRTYFVVQRERNGYKLVVTRQLYF